MSADVGGLRMLARELGEHEQFQVHAHVLENAANEIWVMQKKLEQHQQMAEKTMQTIVLEQEENDELRAMVHSLLQCHVEDTDTCAKCRYRSPLHGGCMADVKADELGVEL